MCRSLIVISALSTHLISLQVTYTGTRKRVLKGSKKRLCLVDLKLIKQAERCNTKNIQYTLLRIRNFQSFLQSGPGYCNLFLATTNRWRNTCIFSLGPRD